MVFFWYWSVEIVGAKLSKAMKKDKKTRGLGGHCWWWGGPETGERRNNAGGSYLKFSESGGVVVTERMTVVVTH